ncbi:MAG: restriction endonuclease [Flavobacterium sp. MedPE-SWcel]|uniref:HNH endonuclease n=1 Tax=uncultured Flavobacterium sp. TaxID=165435 RepID=UPI00090FF885|nr:HNH endonuclease [uncultured Flavobacterium sp.]OIQ19281.1 MAG: restriction endonuclease [Flavobacterium sp. MedPE-SWcel]
MAKKLWTREEMILALNLYQKIEFGKTHKNNPEIIKLANVLGRTPSAVGMRLGNFASIDPVHRDRGINGLKNSGGNVKSIWDEFFNDKESLIFESEKILTEKQNLTIEGKYHDQLNDIKNLKGEDKTRLVKTRVNQSIFRQTILTNYTSKCALTGIDIPSLLFASHIIPWSENKEERLNPENGICLSALYDKAFDKGLLSFSNDYQILLSSTLKEKKVTEYYKTYFAPIENKKLSLPIKHNPSKLFLEYHRDTIFDKKQNH